MDYQIDELLKNYDYNIYQNENIDDTAITLLANVIAEDERIDLNTYFALIKCSSKFCWFNYLKIIEKLSDADRLRGIPVLFELLKDSNWPTFQKTMEILITYEKNLLISCADKYYEMATLEDDDMWMENIQLLRNALQ